MTVLNEFFLKKFLKNEKGRDFVMGDLHGCFNLLMDKLSEINFDTNKDRLFSVGDLCDRGPDSVKCLQLIYEDWFFTTLGNHEWLWARAHDAFHQLDIFNRTSIDGRANYQIFVANGGEIIDTNYVFTKEKLTKFVKDVAHLPRVIEIETRNNQKVGIIHAHMPFDDWEELYVTNYTIDELDEKMLWEHAFFINKKIEDENAYVVKNIDKIYHGHTVTEDVIEFANRIYIDTNALMEYTNGKGKLTILEI
jgi:serine/threonine protein phosphatase 1